VAGDVIVLGAGGKMGPTLATMAKLACDGAGSPRRVIAVSRFTSDAAERALRDAGVETITCDLLDHSAVSRLPDVPNVLFLVGQKFGTRDAPSRTWMMNVVVPAICGERYAESRIVAFSTGNVYPLVPVAGAGARESDAPGPIGEYAASCLGRERVFEHVSATRGTPVAIVRLNYAIDLRYGVLTDIATRVATGAPVSLTMGWVNVIWQRDANRTALELLAHAASPPLTVNVTGPSKLSVRALAAALGQRLGRTPVFEGVEADDALLSDTSVMQSLVGAPEMDLDTMLDWVAEWVRDGRPLLGKPTHFGERSGAF
jgi:nucleoside-diphosphate-sugar epimerase